MHVHTWIEKLPSKTSYPIQQQHTFIISSNCFALLSYFSRILASLSGSSTTTGGAFWRFHTMFHNKEKRKTKLENEVLFLLFRDIESKLRYAIIDSLLEGVSTFIMHYFRTRYVDATI